MRLGGRSVFLTGDTLLINDLREVPQTCLPVHHGDYGVFRDPVDTFHSEVLKRGLAGVRSTARGETVTL